MSFGLLILPALGALMAAGSDLVRFRIPNALCLGLAILFFPVAYVSGIGPGLLLQHAGAGAAMLAAGFLLFLARVWGGGDAKLFAALSLWLGWQRLLPFIFVTALAGGVLALMLLLLRRISWPETVRRHPALRRLLSARNAVPYGVAMAGGMMWSLWRVWH